MGVSGLFGGVRSRRLPRSNGRRGSRRAGGVRPRGYTMGTRRCPSAVALTGRSADDDVALGLDVDPPRMEVRRDGQALAVASDDAEVAAGSIRQLHLRRAGSARRVGGRRPGSARVRFAAPPATPGSGAHQSRQNIIAGPPVRVEPSGAVMCTTDAAGIVSLGRAGASASRAGSALTRLVDRGRPLRRSVPCAIWHDLARPRPPASRQTRGSALAFLGRGVSSYASSVRFDHRAAWPMSGHSRSASPREKGLVARADVPAVHQRGPVDDHRRVRCGEIPVLPQPRQEQGRPRRPRYRPSTTEPVGVAREPSHVERQEEGRRR